MRSQVGEFFTVKFEELRLLQRTISEVAETLGAQSRSLEALVSTQKVQIEESLRRLESQLTANHARDARIHRLSRQIGREIQQVVIGVQFQDLINQKLQHTAGAVARITLRPVPLNGYSLAAGEQRTEGKDSRRPVWPAPRGAFKPAPPMRRYLTCDGGRNQADSLLLRPLVVSIVDWVSSPWLRSMTPLRSAETAQRFQPAA